MDIVKISVLGIAGIVLGLFLKESKPEYSLYVSVCICLVIVGYSVTKLLTLFDSFRQLQQYIPIDSQYISTLLKIIGVAYLGQFSAGVCKDAGYSSMAGQIEIFCKLSIMVISMPILLALLETISSFLA